MVLSTAKQVEYELFKGVPIVTTGFAQTPIIDIRRRVPQSFLFLVAGAAVDIKLEYAVTNDPLTAPVAASFGDNADVFSTFAITGRFVRFAAPAINTPYVVFRVTGVASNGADTVLTQVSMWAAEAA